MALAAVTRGLGAVEQGRVASRFSAFAYSGAGVMVVLDGVAGQAVGTLGGAIVTGVVYAAVAAVAIGLVVRRTFPRPDPKVRTTAGVMSAPQNR